VSIIAALQETDHGQAVRGAGVAGRVGQPADSEASSDTKERPGER